jgi:8-oxo-dGTP pyrophosphatase MutT (NUDIX family)
MRLDEREHERRVAAVVLLRGDGAALLQHRDEKAGLKHAGMWVPPGGHSEPGELMEACARREFAEETEYRLGALHHLLDFVDDEDPDTEPSQVTVYWSLYDGRQSFVCREGQALEFIPRAEAARYPIPAYLVEVWDHALEAFAGAGKMPCAK